ncbi:cytochrome c [Massilia sp.]|uniref:c-type cytochrome n=1 Tax=Massilia sp. TaxID=1882437 RepID=UPI00352FE95D
MKNLARPIALLVGAAVFGVIIAAIYIYAGWYNIGADQPHWRLTASVIETLRERSIERHAAEIKVPDLTDQQLILKGAGQYAAMCTQCHLAPGNSSSEIRPGLYPRPPELSKVRIDPRVAFWVTKHGIKMTAMPAWGSGHDDATIWSIVAFLNKLPDLSPQAYREIVDKAPPDKEMESMGHGEHSRSPQKPGESKETMGDGMPMHQHSVRK